MSRYDPQGQSDQHDSQGEADQPGEHHDLEDLRVAAFQDHGPLIARAPS
jgi:hypothetical protein